MKTAGYWITVFGLGLSCLVIGPEQTLGQAPNQPVQGPPHGAPTPAAPPAAPAGVVVTKDITANVTVTDAMLLNAGQDQDNWLLHGRTYDNQRFSPLKQINKTNVNRLVPVSIMQTGVANSFE